MPEGSAEEIALKVGVKEGKGLLHTVDLFFPSRLTKRVCMDTHDE